LADNVPNTLENTREFDETIVEDDEEVAADEATDEFSQYFQSGVAPKILVTTSKGPSAVRSWIHSVEYSRSICAHVHHF
jgi:ribosome production factor 1